MAAGDRYNRIGRSYALTRKEDPRIATAIQQPLNDALTVLMAISGANKHLTVGTDWPLRGLQEQIFVADRAPWCCDAADNRLATR